MLCSNCRAEIAPTSRFCASCGAKCAVTMPMSPTKSKVWVWLVGAFIGLILLTAIIRNTSSTAPAAEENGEKPSKQSALSAEANQRFKVEIASSYLDGK